VGPHILSAAMLTAYVSRLGFVLVVGFIMSEDSNDPKGKVKFALQRIMTSQRHSRYRNLHLL
jgi:hypothetical protein